MQTGIDNRAGRPWWESRWHVAALILLAMVPLVYPVVPPLVDLPGHMGRYRVELDLANSPELQRYYRFEWQAIGNLGVDLLVVPLARIFGLELAVKLIVMAIPPLTVAGFLWVAREVHHRLPPTAFFALPLAYSFPFLFGFVNFALGMALAMCAFGLWLRLGRTDRGKLRSILFVPISIAIFFTHAFAWGTLGLLCFSAEAVRQHDKGLSWWKAGLAAAYRASVMAVPIVFMLAWRGEEARQLTYGWFDWVKKWQWIYSAVRDRWKIYDIATVDVFGLVLLFAVFHRRLEFSRNLAFSALVLLAAFLVLPWTIFGSAYADMRLMPYVIALALLAIRFRGQTDLPLARALAVGAVALYAIRIAGSTASLAIAADDQQEKLEALNHVPKGAAMVTLVGQSCTRTWPLFRDSHLSGLAIVRRHAFSNDQWAIAGANLLKVVYAPAGRFSADPSQMVRPTECTTPAIPSLDRALQILPRDAFDYLWLISPPPHDPRLLAGFRPIWRGKDSTLYAIERPAAYEAAP